MPSALTDILCSIMVQTLNHQRGKRDLLNVIAAGSKTFLRHYSFAHTRLSPCAATLGASFGVLNGPRAIAMGGLGGGALSLWFGLLLQGSWVLENYVEKQRAIESQAAPVGEQTARTESS
jgi:hypothetical protein